MYAVFKMETEGCSKRLGKKGKLNLRKNQFLIIVWEVWERKLTSGLELT